MNRKYIYYGLGGLAAAIAAAAIIKKKPSLTALPGASSNALRSTLVSSPTTLPAPKTYVTATGDLWPFVVKRFGASLQAVQAANGFKDVKALNVFVKKPGSILKLPPGVADMGATQFAKGSTR